MRNDRILSIIIVSYKNDDLTIRFCEEELCKINILVNIIIVNNEATDLSDNKLAISLDGIIVKSTQFHVEKSNIYIIHNPENSGFAKGNNIGARFAIDVLHSDYLLFTNNDIKFLAADVVEQMVEKLNNTKNVGIIGPKIIGLRGEHQSPEPYMSFWDRHIWMYLCTPFYSKEKKNKRFRFDYSQNAQEGYHYKLMGSFFMVRSQDFLKCGMMDENTFLYAEEPILTERMKKIGLQPYYYPKVSVLHDHGTTTKKHINNKIDDIKFESECYYYQTYIHTPIWQIWIGKIIHTLLKIIK